MSRSPENLCELVALTRGREGDALAIKVTAEAHLHLYPADLRLLHAAVDFRLVRPCGTTDDIITDAKIYHFRLTARGAALYATFP